MGSLLRSDGLLGAGASSSPGESGTAGLQDAEDTEDAEDAAVHAAIALQRETNCVARNGRVTQDSDQHCPLWNAGIPCDVARGTLS